MNWKHCLAPALTLALAVPAAAQSPAMGQQQPQQERRDPQAQSDVIRADQLIGEPIRNQQSERIGRIADLGLNVQDGRIAYVVVNRGGAWGIGGETVALPWKQVQPDPTARAIRIDQQELQQARRIDTRQNWPIYIAYEGQEAVGTAGGGTERRVVPMSTVVGMDVRNKQGEQLGHIDDVASGATGP